MTVALERVTVRREQQEQATQLFYREIRKAAEQHSIREIAAAAGLSPARIFQIIGKKGGSDA